MIDVRDISLQDLVQLVRSRELRATELTADVLARIELVNPALNAWVTWDPESAMAQAAAIDRRIDAGDDVGALAGVPLAVKDLEDAAGFATRCGSLLHAEDAVSAVDSLQVARLRRAGCVVIGKTTTSEFGWAGDTVTRACGATVNPWQPTRSSGGSSGGSAAALASGMAALATGSDGGGSIRLPAALCGFSGLKPTHGVVPLGGDRSPPGGVLTVRGPMARTATDIAAALSVVAGPDDTDCHSLERLPFDLGGHERLPTKVVWAPAAGFAVDAEIARVCHALVAQIEAAGTEVIEVPRLFRTEPLGDWFSLWAIYRERAHGHLRGTDDWELIEPGLRDLMDHGQRHVDARAVMAALDAIHLHNADLASVFVQASIVLTPTVAGQTAVSGESGTVNGEPSIFWAPFTQATNLTRHPAGTVCAGFTSDGMPVGLQVIGRHRHDAEVLGVMSALEELAGVRDARPPDPHRPAEAR